MISSILPNGDEIKAYAKSSGLRNVRFEYQGLFGWMMFGDGKSANGRPLVWAVAEECGISWGCGADGQHQIRPERFVSPA